MDDIEAVVLGTPKEIKDNLGHTTYLQRLVSFRFNGYAFSMIEERWLNEHPDRRGLPTKGGVILAYKGHEEVLASDIVNDKTYRQAIYDLIDGSQII